MPYVVFTKPNQEFRAERQLENQGYKVFLPLCRDHKTADPKPLFPRYVFIWVPDGKAWTPITNTLGVSNILKLSEKTPTVVGDGVIDAIRKRMECDGGAVVLGEDRKSREFKPGQRIKVIGGTHAGLSGLFVSRKKDRITALFYMFGRQIKTTVDEASVVC